MNVFTFSNKLQRECLKTLVVKEINGSLETNLFFLKEEMVFITATCVEIVFIIANIAKIKKIELISSVYFICIQHCMYLQK